MAQEPLSLCSWGTALKPASSPPAPNAQEKAHRHAGDPQKAACTREAGIFAHSLAPRFFCPSRGDSRRHWAPSAWPAGALRWSKQPQTSWTWCLQWLWTLLNPERTFHVSYTAAQSGLHHLQSRFTTFLKQTLVGENLLPHSRKKGLVF